MSNFSEDYNIKFILRFADGSSLQINIFIFFSFLIHFLVILLYLYVYLSESQENHGGTNT